MKYELGLRLKNAGFPQRQGGTFDEMSNHRYGFPIYICPHSNCHAYGCAAKVYCPPLAELIDRCETIYLDINKLHNGWGATDHYYREIGVEPEEAVANLWMKIHKV